MHGGNSGDINILNTEVGNSVEYGILVSYNRQGSITIMNSTISENGNRGIYLTSGRTRLFVSGSNFLRNRRGALFAHTNNERSLTKHVLDKNVFLVTNTIYADSNWWGAGMVPTIKAKIRDKRSYYSLPVVIFEPFKKLSPRSLLSCKYYCFVIIVL